MTLQERYQDLTQPFTMFRKTFAPRIDGPLTIDKLKAYAETLAASHLPIMQNAAKEVRRNIANANNDLNGTI